MSDDRVLLVVVFDCINEKNETETFKIRIRERDLPQGDDAVSGEQLYVSLVDRHGLDPSNAAIDIYNTATESFQSLDVNENDIAKRFGKCIRCTMTCDASSTGAKTRAIMGRYFPYNADEGLQVAGTTIRVQETPNIPGAGTGLNVWDGALLLAKYLEQRPELVKGKRVLELGAGCGLVGIAAGVLGAKEVVLTDLPYCLPLMKENVNRHRSHAAISGCEEWNVPYAIGMILLVTLTLVAQM